MKDAKGNLEQMISKEDVVSIVKEYGYKSKHVKSYEVKNACDGETLGLLADYLKLNVSVDAKDEERVFSFFIKNVPENEAKASMIQNVGVHERELVYYKFINSNLQVSTLKPWSAKFVTCIGTAIVMEDLAALQYTMRDKYERLDKQHTLQALKTLARFHASSIIYEEKRSKDLRRPYRITEDHEQYLDSLFYSGNNIWFIQCIEGTWEVIKALSKYSKNKETLKIIEDRWDNIWNGALHISRFDEQRCVLSHRDLWNNNLLFHYEELDDGTLVPDDCVLVDFQMVSCQPPAADVMLLLYANVKREYRKENLTMFLNFYYDELKSCFLDNDIDIQSILTSGDFHISARNYKQWGIIAFSGLAPLIFGEDSIIAETLQNPEQFNNMMMKERGNFIKEMMLKSDRYSKIVMDILEEIVDEYVLK